MKQVIYNNVLLLLFRAVGKKNSEEVENAQACVGTPR